MDLLINHKVYKVLVKGPSAINPNNQELVVCGSDWRNMMDDLAFQPGQLFVFTLVRKGVFSLTVFNDAGMALMYCETYATYVLRNALCHVGEEAGSHLFYDNMFTYIKYNIRVSIWFF